MNRRRFLTAFGGGVASLAGGAAVAKATRADITADPSLVRGEGDPISTTATVTRDSVEYVEATNSVRYSKSTESFEEWARRNCVIVGSDAVMPAIDERIHTPIEGVGKGVRGLAFGLVITVDHTIARDRDGEILSEPNMELDELVAVAPEFVTATVILEGQEYTRDVPVVVGHSETQHA